MNRKHLIFISSVQKQLKGQFIQILRRQPERPTTQVTTEVTAQVENGGDITKQQYSEELTDELGLTAAQVTAQVTAQVKKLLHSSSDSLRNYLIINKGRNWLGRTRP